MMTKKQALDYINEAKKKKKTKFERSRRKALMFYILYGVGKYKMEAVTYCDLSSVDVADLEKRILSKYPRNTK